VRASTKRGGAADTLSGGRPCILALRYSRGVLDPFGVRPVRRGARGILSIRRPSSSKRKSCPFDPLSVTVIRTHFGRFRAANIGKMIGGQRLELLVAEIFR
jgi:hypothetical protein